MCIEVFVLRIVVIVLWFVFKKSVVLLEVGAFEGATVSDAKFSRSFFRTHTTHRVYPSMDLKLKTEKSTVARFFVVRHCTSEKRGNWGLQYFLSAWSRRHSFANKHLSHYFFIPRRSFNLFNSSSTRTSLFLRLDSPSTGV